VAWSASAEATYLLDSKVLFDLFKGADSQEGVKAFLDKRPVNFTASMRNDAPEVWPWWDAVDTKASEKSNRKESKL